MMQSRSQTKSEQLFATAQNLIPGGVNSPVRAFRGVGGTPRFIRSARGATITDVDGRTYIDYVGSWGPMILGHADEEVVAAVQEVAAKGTSFGAPSELEVELAQEVIDAVPSVEMVRMVSSLPSRMRLYTVRRDTCSSPAAWSMVTLRPSCCSNIAGTS